MAISTQHIIEQKIAAEAAGKVIFISDYKDLGTEPALKMAFSRMVKNGKLKRLSHGIYQIPNLDFELGHMYPSLEEIAKAIAVRDRARIRPTGVTALNKLGLSTQVPMKVVYLTDGSPRIVKIGRGGIRFKTASPRKLAMKGQISSLAIAAMEELGQGGITTEIKEKIKKLLVNEDVDALRHDLKLAPSWIFHQLKSLI